MKVLMILTAILYCNSLMAQYIRSRADYLILYREAAKQFSKKGIDVRPGIYIVNRERQVGRSDLVNISDGDRFHRPKLGLDIVVGYASGEVANTRNEIWARKNGQYFLLRSNDGVSQNINNGIPLTMIPAIEGMFIITKSKKVIFRYNDPSRNTSIINKNNIRLFDVKHKYYTLSRSGKSLIIISNDLEVAALHRNGDVDILGKVKNHKRRGPQVSISGDGIFFPQGDDRVEYLKFDFMTKVKKRSTIFTKRRSEKILFSNNEVIVVQQKAGGGRGKFYLNENGSLVSAAVNRGAQKMKLTAADMNSLMEFTEDWGARAVHGEFSDIVKDSDLLKSIRNKLMSQEDTWVNIVGPYGVGKTSALKSFANYLYLSLIKEKYWKDYEVLKLSMANLYRLKLKAEESCVDDCVFGETDEFTMKTKLMKGKRVVFLVDDFLDQPSLGATNASNAMDLFLNTFREGLSKNEIKIVTTSDSKLWNKITSDNPQLNHMAQSIVVKSPDYSTLSKIIESKMKRYGRLHNVSFEKNVVDIVMESSEELFPLDIEPLRSVNALKDMVRELADPNGKNITISMRQARRYFLSYSFNSSKLENIDLDDLRNFLDENIVGQLAAKKNIIESLAPLQMGIVSMDKPLGLFLFTGPTGVGKTYSAELVADFLKVPLVKVDMNYFDKFKRGNIRNSILRNEGHPFVLLLDEVDKRNDGYSAGDRLSELRGLFQTGIYAAGTENELNLRNAIIIMTANYAEDLILDLGKIDHDAAIEKFSDYVLDVDGNTPDEDKIPRHVWSHLKEETSIFFGLTEEELEKVAVKFASELSDELQSRDGIELVVGQKFIQNTVATSFQRKMGVVPIKQKIKRSLKRTITSYLQSIKSNDRTKPLSLRIYPRIRKLYVDMSSSGRIIVIDNTHPNFPSSLMRRQ